MISTAFSPYRLYKEIEANHLLKLKKKFKRLFQAYAFILVSLPLLRNSLFNVLTHRLQHCTCGTWTPWLSSSTELSWKTFPDMSVLHQLFCYLCCGINGADTLQPLLSGQQVPVKQQLVCHLSDHSMSDKTIIQRRHDISLENTFFFPEPDSKIVVSEWFI